MCCIAFLNSYVSNIYSHFSFNLLKYFELIARLAEEMQIVILKSLGEKL